MPWIDVNRNDIYYTEAGTGQPIVFLHGFSSCSEAWFQQFASFGDRYHVIAYDSINHGHSANSPRDEDEPDGVDELEGFLAAMNIERPVLIGNSMGAATLLRWATWHSNDAAALVASGMGAMTPDAQRTAPTREPLTHEVNGWLVQPSVGAMAEAIAVLLEQPAKRRALSKPPRRPRKGIHSRGLRNGWRPRATRPDIRCLS